MSLGKAELTQAHHGEVRPENFRSCHARDILDFLCMVGLDDNRWSDLTGGYGTKFDPRPLLALLETGNDTVTAWHRLWDELYHQGDVGEASYAAIPQLVRIHQMQGAINWNTYAIAAIIELVRPERENPPVPNWLKEDYFRALEKLAEMGTTEVLRAKDSKAIGSILGFIAVCKGLRTYGRFLVEYSEEELLDFEFGT